MRAGTVKGTRLRQYLGSRSCVLCRRHGNVAHGGKGREARNRRKATVTRASTLGSLEQQHQYKLRSSRNKFIAVGMTESRGKTTVSITLEEPEGDAMLRWWTFRESSENIEVAYTEACKATILSDDGALLTPFTEGNGGQAVVALNFPSSDAPFYIGFNVTYTVGPKAIQLRPPDQSYFACPVGFIPGSPLPLGAFSYGDWVNFTVPAAGSSPPALCLGSGKAGHEPSIDFELELNPFLHRTGDIWHCALKRSSDKHGFYAFRVDDPDVVEGFNKGRKLIVDPFCDDVAVAEDSAVLSVVPGQQDDSSSPDGWEDDQLLRRPMDQSVIIELDFHTTGVLRPSTGGIDVFDAIQCLADELAPAGINTAMLRGVVFEGSLTGLVPSKESLGSRKFKSLIMHLHQMDVEAILELDCLQMLKLLGSAHLNEPVAMESLRQAVRFLVSEYHLDGICFIHAEKLTHGEFGVVMDRPPIVEDLASDPGLCDIKLIASPFGCHLLPREGVRGFPHWSRWAEVNERFTTDLHSFYSGDEVEPANLTGMSTRLTGSADLLQEWEDGGLHLFAGRRPCFGMNAPSGLGKTPLLKSKVSPKTAAAAADGIRWSIIAAAFLAQGVPLIRLVDISHEKWAEELSMLSRLCTIRETYHHFIQKHSFEDLRDLRWHSVDAESEPRWNVEAGGTSGLEGEQPAPVSPEEGEAALGPSLESKFIGMSIWSENEKDAIYAAFNGNDAGVIASLPVPPKGHVWHLAFDSLRMPPSEISPLPKDQCTLQAKSAVIAVLQPRPGAKAEARAKKAKA